MRRKPPQCPLLEFDPDREALFEPAATQAPVDAPELAVGCFLPEIIAAASGGASELMRLPSREPLLTIEWKGQRLGVFYPGQGAPLAAATLERVIAAGCRVIVFCGGAGALVSELALGDVVIPDAALEMKARRFTTLRLRERSPLTRMSSRPSRMSAKRPRGPTSSARRGRPTVSFARRALRSDAGAGRAA